MLETPRFGCADLARGANHFIQLGDVDGPAELKRVFREVTVNPGAARGVDKQERLGWICRMVFTSKDQVPLNPAPFGMLTMSIYSMPLSRWPYYPLAESEGVWFVMDKGLLGSGAPPDGPRYVDYCVRNGTFRRTPFDVPNREEAKIALQRLRKTKAWADVLKKDPFVDQDVKQRVENLESRLHSQIDATPL